MGDRPYHINCPGLPVLDPKPQSTPASTETLTSVPPLTPIPTHTPSPIPTSISPPALDLVQAGESSGSRADIDSGSVAVDDDDNLGATDDNTIAGIFTLLKPLSLDEPSYGLTEFEWQWNGSITPNQGFEVRVWREGEAQVGVHNAVLDNQTGRVEQIDKDRYRLIIDITNAPGVQGRSGEYLWIVGLVQISPNYADLGYWAEPLRLRFEAPGDTGGGGSDDSDGRGPTFD